MIRDFLRLSFVVGLFLLQGVPAGAADHDEKVGDSSPIRFLASNVSERSYGCSSVNQEEISGDVADWHNDCSKKVYHVKETARLLRADKNPNFAMFCIRILFEEQVEKRESSVVAAASSADKQKKQAEQVLCNYSGHVFASGGDLNFLESLESRVREEIKEQVEIKCPGHYWSPFPEQSNDGCLRRDIADLFSFEEAITSQEKERVVDGFRGRIGKRDYFADMTLSRSAQDRLVDSCRASLHFQLFKDPSNARAHTLGLMDKQKKGDDSWHLNDLFGGAFQLNFADSEQAIRAFIYKIELRTQKLPQLPAVLDFSAISSSIEAYYKLYKKQGDPKPETEELEKISGPIDHELVRIFQDSGIRFVLNIASYYDMCHNCQATFLCDIVEKKTIQNKCLLMLLETQKLKKELKWYLVGRLHQYGLAQKISPMVSFLVSYQHDYNS
jgi:hypothetical protein